MEKLRFFCLLLVLACLLSGCVQPRFGIPENLGTPINSWFVENGPVLSADKKTLYFHSNRAGNSDDIWYATRDDVNAPWNEPRLLTVKVNDHFQSYGFTMNRDELTAYFASNSTWLGSEGNYDIWSISRESLDSPWEAPVNVGNSINSPGAESDPCISKDGLELFFAELDSPPFRAGGKGGGDIWISRRQSQSDPWGTPETLSIVNSPFTDFTPALAGNDLFLFFASNRKDGYGDFDIWVSRRTSLTEPWGQPVNIGPPINTAGKECRPHISSDESTLYFGSSTEKGFGGMDIWMAEIPALDKVGR